MVIDLDCLIMVVCSCMIDLVKSSLSDHQHEFNVDSYTRRPLILKTRKSDFSEKKTERKIVPGHVRGIVGILSGYSALSWLPVRQA